MLRKTMFVSVTICPSVTVTLVASDHHLTSSNISGFCFFCSLPAMLHLTPTTSLPPLYPQKYSQDVKDSNDSSILEHHHPTELVDMVLEALEKARIGAVEWRSLLYRRMNVPTLVKVNTFNLPMMTRNGKI